MNTRVPVAAASALVALVAAQSLGAFGGNVPTALSPAPILLVLLAFLGVPMPLIASAPALLGWLWFAPQISGAPRLPSSSVVLFKLVAVLSAVIYLASWNAGLEHQGLGHTLACTLLNLLLAGASGWAVWRARKEATTARVLVAHILILVWLVSYAFPYLGEMP